MKAQTQQFDSTPHNFQTNFTGNNKYNDLYAGLITQIQENKTYLFSNSPEQINAAFNYFAKLYECPQCHSLYLEQPFQKQLLRVALEHSDNIHLCLSFSNLLYNLFHRNIQPIQEIYSYVLNNVQKMKPPLTPEVANMLGNFFYIINYSPDSFYTLISDPNFIPFLTSHVGISLFLDNQICYLVPIITNNYNNELKKQRERFQDQKLQKRHEIIENPLILSQMRQDYKKKKHEFQYLYQNVLLVLFSHLFSSPILAPFLAQPEPNSSLLSHFKLLSKIIFCIFDVNSKNPQLSQAIGLLNSHSIWNISVPSDINFLETAALPMSEELRVAFLGEKGQSLFQSALVGDPNQYPIREYLTPALKILATRVDNHAILPPVCWTFKEKICKLCFDINIPKRIKIAAGFCIVSFCKIDPHPFYEAFNQDMVSACGEFSGVVKDQNYDILPELQNQIQDHTPEIGSLSLLFSLFFFLEDDKLNIALLSALWRLNDYFVDIMNEPEKWKIILHNYDLDKCIKQLIRSQNKIVSQSAHAFYFKVIDPIVYSE